jgi:hypothetical protein
MVHWAFLIPAFILGGLSCWGVLYWAIKAGGEFIIWLYGE